MLKYEIIGSKIIDYIDNEGLKEGDKLPSIRRLSDIYGCNKSTIIKALEKLERDNRIYVIPRSGYYIMPHSPNESMELIDFTMVKPEDRFVPYKEFNHCIDKSIDMHRYGMFGYTDTEGLDSLRAVVKEDLTDNYIYTSKDNICIVSGAQQGIDIAFSMLSKKGCILVEEPTYNLIFEMCRLKGISIKTFKRSVDGVDFKELIDLIKDNDVSMIYLNSRLQNPMGVSLNEDTKKRLVSLASEYNFYILEDDCLMDIDCNSRYMPMHYYDVDDRVIYLRSYSKAFIPGIRVGAAVLPNSLRDEFVSYKRYSDLSTPVINQGALEIFISSGMFDKHRKRIKTTYSNKMRLAVDFIKKHGEGIVETMDYETGVFMWLRPVKRVPINSLIRTLESRNVMVTSGSNFYRLDKGNNGHIRLSIYNLTDDMIRDGLISIIEETKKLIKE